LNRLIELGLDAHTARKTGLKLHAHSVLYAHKLTTTSSTRHALEKSSCSRSWSGAGGCLSPSRSSL